MEQNRKRQTVLLTAVVITGIILVIVIGRFIDRYTPGKERMDLSEYFGLTEEDQLAIVQNQKILDAKAQLRDGEVYIDYETLHDAFNARFYWDANENILLYTTPDHLVSVPAAGSEYYIDKEKKTESYTIVYADTNTAYIAMDFVKEYTDLDYQTYDDPGRIVVVTDWSDQPVIDVKKTTQLRQKGGIKSLILADVEKSQQLFLLEEGDKWDKVATDSGIVGYVRSKCLGKKATHSYDHTPVTEEFSHILKDNKINMAWHQVTTTDANSTVASVLSNTKGLNVIVPTWFYLNDNDGNLENLASADYVNYCHSQGVEVWALVSNLENKDVDSTDVLTHTSKRTNVVNQLIAAAIQYNFDGINVDFEALSSDVGDGYIQFIRELSLKCANNGIVLSVDNYVPSDYTAFYNRKEQANFADYVVMMGYDEHYAGSDEGSVASIGFVKDGISATLEEVPAQQLILAAPFYTRVWIETPKASGEDVAAAADDALPYDLTSQAVGMQEAWKMVSANGVEPQWLDDEGQYYAEYQQEGITYKIWLEDEKSLELKLQAASENGLAGMAFWKLGFEDATLWDMILKYMN